MSETNTCAAEQVTQTVVCHKPAHVYEVSGGQPINFVHKEGAEVVQGTTNEDLLNVLIHRTEILDSQMHCEENVAALEKLREALAFFEKRSASRSTPATTG